MAATGKTPILLYGSTSPTNAPAAGNLTNSSDGCEIAINVADKNLFFKDSTNAVNTVPIRQSSASSNGWLSSTDWTTFNSKQPAGTYVTSVTGTAPVVSSGGTTPAISMAAANGSTNGYLTSADWTTFNGKAPAVTYTSTYIPYGQGTTTPAQSANLAFDGTNLLVAGLLRTNSNAATPAGGVYHLYHAVADSRSWKFRNDVYAYGDFAIDQSTTQTGSTYATKMYFAPTGGVSVGDTTDPGAGNLRVGTGNLVIGTSGKGIDFSATAGTGTSELLADYEEGTWTPQQGAGLTVVGAFSSGGTYTKVGRVVNVIGYVAGATSVAVGSAGIITNNLPYSAATNGTGTSINNGITASVGNLASDVYIYSAGAIAATPKIFFSVTYTV